MSNYLVKIQDANSLANKTAVILIPPAGLGVNFYIKWLKYFPKNLLIYAIRLPGRETRLMEHYDKSINDIVTNISKEISETIKIPYVIFGHSLGALIAYELSVKVQQNKLHLMNALICSGHKAPHLPSRMPKISHLVDKEFIKAMSIYNELPLSILNEPQLARIVISQLRSDIKLDELYHYKENLKLECELIVLGGCDDKTVSPIELTSWSLLTKDEFTLHVMSGGHFFINDNILEIVNIIQNKASPKKPFKRESYANYN